MMPSSRLDCPLSLKTPNMGNTGLSTLFNRYSSTPSFRYKRTLRRAKGKRQYTKASAASIRVSKGGECYGTRESYRPPKNRKPLRHVKIATGRSPKRIVINSISRVCLHKRQMAPSIRGVGIVSSEIIWNIWVGPLRETITLESICR